MSLSKKHRRIVKLFLSNNIDLNKTGINIHNFLLIAININSAQIVDYLLNK